MKRTRLPSLGPRGEGWVALQGLLFIAFALAAAFGPGWPAGARGALLVIGIVVAIFGAVQVAAAFLGLGKSLTALPHPKPDAELRTDGVYGMVRHPIYGGVLLGLVGVALATSPAALVPTLLLALLFEGKRRVEEAWLEERFEGYAEYERRVRRAFIPGLW